MKLKTRQDLLTLWCFSEIDSVHQVAQNVDIMKRIFVELDPVFQYPVDTGYHPETQIAG